MQSLFKKTKIIFHPLRGTLGIVGASITIFFIGIGVFYFSATDFILIGFFSLPIDPRESYLSTIALSDL